MRVHNFEAIVTAFYHIVIYVTVDCNSRVVSIINSSLTLKKDTVMSWGRGELLLLPLVLLNRLNKRKSAVFLYFRLSLFLGYPIFQII